MTTEHLDPAAAMVKSETVTAWHDANDTEPCIESTKIILFGLESDHCFALATN